MTTDRELLEAAARAAGIVVLRSRLHDPLQRDMLIDLRPEHQPRGWNPLTDDGDALRLAVKLNIGVQCHVHNGSGYALAQCGQMESQAFAVTVEPGDNPCVATRRAIVRAAAAMAQEAG